MADIVEGLNFQYVYHLVYIRRNKIICLKFQPNHALRTVLWYIAVVFNKNKKHERIEDFTQILEKAV